jgi:hypothetical protein
VHWWPVFAKIRDGEEIAEPRSAFGNPSEGEKGVGALEGLRRVHAFFLDRFGTFPRGEACWSFPGVSSAFGVSGVCTLTRPEPPEDVVVS